MVAHSHHLDKIDLKILRILQENGRITNLQLSSDIGLSPAPTLERVKKLEQAGYIRSYHAQVDDKMLGLGIRAFIQISLTRQIANAIDNFRAQIAEIPEIVECYQVTGDADYFMKAMVKDISAFERLIAQKLSRIEEIGQMKTMVILSKVKDSKVMPVDYEGKDL
jgi:Lrp/AsnC family transcriptional regulator, leucine-responsive regulatory protein